MSKQPVIVSATTQVIVPFFDLDPLEIVWHGHYLKYFEIGRGELLQKINYDYPQMAASGYLWPVVECHLKYIRSATLRQVLNITADLIEYEHRLKIHYTISDVNTLEVLTKGYSIQVAVMRETGEMQFASPDVLVDALRANKFID